MREVPGLPQPPKKPVRLPSKRKQTPRMKRARGAAARRFYGGPGRSRLLGRVLRRILMLALRAFRSRRRGLGGTRNHGFKGVVRTDATGFAGMKPARRRLF